MGFFQKMEQADLFVLLDDVQYTKNNFQNRNKFINNNGVEEWFTIGLESSPSKKLIKDVLVSDHPKWKKTILTKLQNTFKIDFSEIYNHDKLVDINIASIEYIRECLGIKVPMVLSSTLNIQSQSSQRLADICKHYKATKYISGAGGTAYLDTSVFDCNVTYFHPDVPNYYTTLQHLPKNN
tara:strand:- start:13071 stop:13613 length:543 start_codon:yes stop_codon:yes gene_type:complete